MKQEEFKANQEYLKENGVYIPDKPTWKNFPYSRELYKRTQGDGDFYIEVEVLDRDHILENLRSFDVNEETILWWNGRGVPFDNIKDLYDDIYQWKEDFIQIAKGMPY